MSSLGQLSQASSLHASVSAKNQVDNLVLNASSMLVAGNDLTKKQAELREVNKKQKTLAELKTEFDILKPDIELICVQLVLFGDIWDSVSRLLFISMKRHFFR